MEYTRSVWYIPPESAKKVNHPASFPEELPYRLIKLYTYSGEVILDPFMGSGTTAVASVRTGRYFVGYEINPEYVQTAQRRLKGVSKELFII